MLQVNREREDNLLSEKNHPLATPEFYKRCILSAWSTPIRWATNPMLCVFANGTDTPQAGGGVILRGCDDAVHFSVPSTRNVGPIRLTMHPTKCLAVADWHQHAGEASRAGGAHSTVRPAGAIAACVLKDCAMGSAATHWEIRGLGSTGQIRWAKQPTKCLTVVANVLALQLLDCGVAP